MAFGLILAFVCLVIAAELLNQCDRENRAVRISEKENWIRASAGRALDRSTSGRTTVTDKSPPTLNRLSNSQWKVWFVVGLLMG